MYFLLRGIPGAFGDLSSTAQVSLFNKCIASLKKNRTTITTTKNRKEWGFLGSVAANA